LTLSFNSFSRAFAGDGVGKFRDKTKNRAMNSNRSINLSCKKRDENSGSGKN